METLEKLYVTAKLTRLVKMTMKDLKLTIKTQKCETTEMKIDERVRPGDSLSATLFKLALEYGIRNTNGSIFTTREGGDTMHYNLMRLKPVKSVVMNYKL